MILPDSICGSWLTTAKRMTAEELDPSFLAALLSRALVKASNLTGIGTDGSGFISRAIV